MTESLKVETSCDFTVADWYEWTVALVLPRSSADPDELKHLFFRSLDWCARFSEDPKQFKKNAIADGELWDYLDDFATQLIESVSISSSELTAYKTTLNKINGGNEYDAKKDVICDCAFHAGVEETQSKECVTYGVTSVTKALLDIDPSLIAEYWDRPYSLYQIAVVRASSQSDAIAARRQKREDEEEERNKKERENDKSRSKVAEIRERHGLNNG